VLEERGTGVAVEVEPAEKEAKLTDQLDALRRAQDRYRRVREIINWMPPSFELPGVRAQVDSALARVRQKIAEKEDEISFLRREQAARLAADARAREDEQFKLRVDKLLEQVRDLYDRQDYKASERLAIRVLQIDPLNSKAEAAKNKARSAFHGKEDRDVRDLSADEFKRSWEDVDEASISYAPLVLYPPNWDQISRRQESAAIGKAEKEEAWKSDIRKKLTRKVTFEFVDTPLDEAISFLRSLANVTMIVDPKVIAGGAPAINLRVTDMSLDLALEWILKLADLEYALKDNAIFISKPQNLTESVELQIYDVSDLTQTIQDFPGPEFQITVVGDTGGGAGAGAANPFTPAPTVAPTLTNIADMIRNRVRPESWDAALGTSIEERGGKLVVMQRPEIHALVNQLLSNFRATQKMMINIESRFLTIREAYLEDIGVEFQGLDPNVLFGDFGDIRRLGAPTGLVQPRVPGATDAVPPNAPFPGIVAPPERMSSGTISTVGSIVNHAIGFFSNDPDTISGQDTSNAVRQGGLSGQVTVFNNTQVQAFVRALAVRENQSTLIAPRLTVFNTQRAHMFVARQQSYVADYEISGDSYDPVIRQFLVGVVLDVKPIVSSDRRYVTLELRPTVTELVNFQTRQIDTFSVNSGANVNILVQLAFPIQFPELAIRRVRTTATCPDGGILLIGGLYRNVRFNAENGVPFLSDLPVVGRLFRWNTVDNAKSNLAILVSPRIILFNEEEEKL
jgi:Flp pilus assembly secretin CpaC